MSFPMRMIRVYVDTSVFGGACDEEFAEASKRFFGKVREGEYLVLVSEETSRELAKAPVAVRTVLEELPPESMEKVSIDDEVKALAQEYVRAGVLEHSSMSDALHVAAASVADADLILSWNFTHIVNFSRIRGFNGVNVMNGYHSMTILSPMEVGDEA